VAGKESREKKVNGKFIFKLCKFLKINLKLNQADKNRS
jgi:hypothetical protein